MASALRSAESARAPRPGRAQALPLSVLTTALWLSLWVALGSFALAVADGLGAHPARRLVIGLLLVVGCASALWQRELVCASLRVRPWLVMPLAAVLLGAAAIDELVGGPYVAFTMISIGLAVIVARSAIVWSCVAFLDVGYALAVLSGRSPEALVHSSALAGVLGQLLSYPFAALSLLGLAGLFKRFTNNAESILEDLRQGMPALTPALTGAIERRGQVRLALPAGPTSTARLTAAEIRVVEGLAAGHAPKELAHRGGVSLATVRSHIKHAKRKTGARTLPELATLVARADWPEISHHRA